MSETQRIIFRQLIESAAKNAGGTIQWEVCSDAHKQWRTVTIKYDEEIKNA
jgi:hypothetical protein